MAQERTSDFILSISQHCDHVHWAVPGVRACDDVSKFV